MYLLHFFYRPTAIKFRVASDSKEELKVEKELDEKELDEGEDAEPEAEEKVISIIYLFSFIVFAII